MGLFDIFCIAGAVRVAPSLLELIAQVKGKDNDAANTKSSQGSQIEENENENETTK